MFKLPKTCTVVSIKSMTKGTDLLEAVMTIIKYLDCLCQRFRIYPLMVSHG